MIARANIYWNKEMQRFLWGWKLVWLYYRMKTWGSRLLLKLSVPKSVRQVFAITSWFKMGNSICVTCFLHIGLRNQHIWTLNSRVQRLLALPCPMIGLASMCFWEIPHVFELWAVAGTLSCHVSFSTMKSLFALYRSASGCFSMRSTHAGLMWRNPFF